MSPAVAFSVLTWAAIVVLFLGLGAVLREVRLLRGLVTRDPDGFTAARPDLSLGRSFAVTLDGSAGDGSAGDGSAADGAATRRMVVAADTGCGLCVAVVRRLARRGAAATLLTHEPAEVWADLAGSLPVISDREAWRAISHLSPPVLMQVDTAGMVHKLLLPVREEQVDSVAAEWGALARDAHDAQGRTPGVVDD
jgi:hypothetical protein